MSYCALYRQYRPQYFRDVIGQDHITTTLKHQVQNGRIAHAYLFSGTRGTGKTTIAKIFARAVNCVSPNDGEPCGQCPICLIGSEGNPDIVEIDAASNNGVHEMRDLREKVRFAPLESKYKVYILDEAHMITHDAFNALLKTLEEPPPHVVFILATTEPQRLPSTILSRCQRFEFHRITVQAIMTRLHYVLDELSLAMEPDGLAAIARAAQGGLRDALSLLDQCIAARTDSETVIAYEQVLDVLGSMDQDFLFRMATALIDGQSAFALQLFDYVIQQGRDIGVFCNDLLQHFRSLMLVHSAKKDARSMLDCSENTLALYEAQAQKTSLAYLLRAVRELSKLESEMKWMTDPRIVLETVFIRLAFPDESISLNALMERVDRLEKQLANPSAQCLSAPNPPPAPPRAQTQKTPADTPPPAPAHDPAIWMDDAPPPFSDADIPSVESCQMSENVSASPTSSCGETAPKTLLPENDAAPVDQSQAQQMFQALLQKQSEAIRKIFVLYQWNVQLLDEKTLELAAPSNCLPTLVKSLAAQTASLSQSIASQYPDIRVVITDKASSVSSAAPAIPASGKDLYSQAVDLFGKEYITSSDEPI